MVNEEFMEFINVYDYYLLPGARAKKPKNALDVGILDWRGKLSFWFDPNFNFDFSKKYELVCLPKRNILITPSKTGKFSLNINKNYIHLCYEQVIELNPEFKKNIVYDISIADDSLKLTVKHPTFFHFPIPTLDPDDQFKGGIREAGMLHFNLAISDWLGTDELIIYCDVKTGMIRLVKTKHAKNPQHIYMNDPCLQLATTVPVRLAEKITNGKVSKALQFYRGKDNSLYYIPERG